MTPDTKATARRVRALETEVEGLRAHNEELVRQLEAARTGRVRRAARRARAQARGTRDGLRGSWRRHTQPRLGTLWQSPPEPLRVPRAYLRARPPSRAPSVTIVTPSFCSVRWLERTLRSVLDQGYPALEYVVQDGGSDDGTVDLLQRHAPALARWTSQPDRGQAHAINAGFAGTRGEIMAFLNADDVLLPGALAHVAAFFAGHPEVDVVYGHRVMIDADGHRVGLGITPPHREDALLPVDWVPQETLFWRRRAWDAAGGRLDEDLQYALDWDLLLRLRSSGATFQRLPRLLAAFRVHPAQKTQALAERGEAECRALRARYTGAPLSHSAATTAAQPYLRSAVAHHIAFRAA
ncbi:MAG: glycosyltransferase family 2 protein, partial [Solirubrobacteraceae bacterium]